MTAAEATQPFWCGACLIHNCILNWGAGCLISTCSKGHYVAAPDAFWLKVRDVNGWERQVCGDHVKALGHFLAEEHRVPA